MHVAFSDSRCRKSCLEISSILKFLDDVSETFSIGCF